MEVVPSFSRVLKDCTVVEGQDFVLQCSVQGTPVPQITWLLNGEFPLLQPPGSSGLACILTWLAPFITQNHTGSREFMDPWSLLLPGWGHWASYHSYLSLELLQHMHNVSYLPGWWL